MQRAVHRRTALVEALVRLWPLLLALLLLAPLLLGEGHPLARDLVFVPRQPWTAASVGLGDAAPRAVPLDAVVSLLTHVVDGGVLARIVLPLTLATAGWGVQRVLAGSDAAARLAAGGLAVWNPFVVERLALGQWALLLAYAALPWVFLAAVAHRRDGRPDRWGAAVLWTALASLTPTGGLLALAALVAGGLARTRRATALLGAGVLLQAPWVTAAFLGGGGGGAVDPDGVGVFAPDTAGPGGPVVALLGLGGIWDDASEPATRATWLGAVAALVTLVLVLLGHSRLRRSLGTGAAARWALLGAGGLLLAVLTTLPWGQDLLRWAVVHLPGAGLLRDGQKLLLPAVLVVATLLGALTQRVAERLRDAGPEVRLSALLPLLAVPVLLLPDATTVTWPTVRPVVLAPGLAAVADRVAAGSPDATVVTLPWRSYRSFGWGSGLTSSDPAARLLDADVVLSDDLQVGDVLVRGEGRRARAIGDALAQGPPAEVLGRLGVTWVVVYPDDPEADRVDTTGLVPVLADDDVALFRVPPPVTPVPGPAGWRVAGVATGFGVAAATLLAGLVLRWRGAGRDLPRRARRRRVHV